MVERLIRIQEVGGSTPLVGSKGDKIMHADSWLLKQRQGLNLESKELMTESRIREWYKKWCGEVYISFSGGKDSTVLLHMVRKIYPEVPAVFIDTGLEFPEIKAFVEKVDNVVWLRPKMPFREVIEKYGYPIVSKENAQKIHEIRTTNSDKLRNKRLYGDEKGYGKLSEKWKFLLDADFNISAKCCDVMKKRPAKSYEKETHRKPFVGTMASDSHGRRTSYLRRGCNAYDCARPMSTPLAFWLEEDIWEYLRKYDLPYSKIYDMGYLRTGCVFCGFGAQYGDGENKFQMLKRTHPKLHSYCMDKLGFRRVLKFMGLPCE